jgi:hypothetical protein
MTLAKGGLVTVDPSSWAVLRVLPFQFNPETVTRTLQPQMAGGEEGGGRSELPRVRAVPQETFKFEAEIDAADELDEGGDQAIRLGIHARLAALEALVYPDSAHLQSVDALARAGTLEVVPPPTPLVILVWGRERVLPVRLTEMSVTEESFDRALNPVRAKVQLGFRALGAEDLGLASKGGALAHAHHRRKEALARMVAGDLRGVGLSGGLG